MEYFVGVTDNQWFRFLSDLRPDEVNFWRPSGATPFRAVSPGAPFLFKLHSPHNYVAGGGFFVRYDTLPLSVAWEAFEKKNGADDFPTLLRMILSHRIQVSRNPRIGCIVLSQPFFFQRGDFETAALAN